MRKTCRAALSVFALALMIGSSAFAQVPHFLTPVTYPVPGASMAAIADINGDGFPDIVTANGFSSQGQGVSLLLGVGDGSFRAARLLVASGNPTMVAIADLNGDGKKDLVIANGPNTTTVSILFGNGDGTFQAPLDLSVGETESIVIADFNGDGKPDIAAGGSNDGVTVLINEGAGNFRTSFVLPANPAIIPNIIAGDFNGDGKQDFLIAGGSYDLQLGNGDGTFHDGGLEALPNIIFALTGDFNGDHRLDIATVSPARLTTVSEISFGQADGTFADSFITNFTAGPLNAVSADFDLDGKVDIFGAGGLSLGHGDGMFQLVGSGFGLRPGFPGFAAAGDLDRNGSPDAIVAIGTGVMVGLNTAGNPPLLASLTTSASFVVGGQAQVTGTLLLGGPAPAGGAAVTLTSSNPAAFFPNGSTVTIPAGSSSANFLISTRTVTVPTPVTISARYHATVLSTTLTVLPAVHIVSVSVSPSSLIGMFGGSPATGTVTLSGPAPSGTVITLSSSNPSVLAVPASVGVTPGSTTATFSASALHVAADTAVTVAASFNGVRQTTTVTVHKETPTVTITKAEYTVSKSQLNVEATSTDRVSSLQVYNATTGVFVGSIPLTGRNTFKGQLLVTGTFTSVAVQSSVGGLAIGQVSQK